MRERDWQLLEIYEHQLRLSTGCDRMEEKGLQSEHILSLRLHSTACSGFPETIPHVGRVPRPLPEQARCLKKLGSEGHNEINFLLS